ncbi:TIGR02328 family protein [Natroniella sulfidigena]|uniref:TIGR02328 family protein n=1 Tax=Natroniella sulfidigena TaxID=723921 RepID=UPI00200B0CD2|nr:TIGR02328 family protein [Natroniella sulfidigena]MCK8817140.1 TIGR02328 family protein [Natroniella sulfidigena]
MRLWHQNLIDKLPRQQLLGQHRECCALRGKGWAKKHATVDYVFKYDASRLVAYHFKVMLEMKEREYKPAEEWFEESYRGKAVGYDSSFCTLSPEEHLSKKIIYPEHNKQYLKECLTNLFEKGVVCRYIEEVIK